MGFVIAVVPESLRLRCLVKAIALLALQTEDNLFAIAVSLTFAKTANRLARVYRFPIITIRTPPSGARVNPRRCSLIDFFSTKAS